MNSSGDKTAPSTPASPAAPAASGVPATAEELRAVLAQLMGVAPEAIGDDANLIGLGLGSLQVMRLVTRWRRAGLTVTFAELAEDPTLAAWSERLARAAAAPDTPA
ncbi:phosphopantetheine-binding protein [Streptomyces sp. NPDC052644]